MHLQFALCLPRDAATIGLVRRIMTSAMHELGVTPDCSDLIRLALSEACSNVVQHSLVDVDYDVRITVTDTTCEIEVDDAGAGLDPSSIDTRFPSEEESGGRGVPLMSAVMDTAEWASGVTSGTTVRLTKALDLEPEALLEALRS
jgi:serine/threonine-protein kinase RsbW